MELLVFRIGRRGEPLAVSLIVAARSDGYCLSVAATEGIRCGWWPDEQGNSGRQTTRVGRWWVIECETRKNHGTRPVYVERPMTIQ